MNDDLVAFCLSRCETNYRKRHMSLSTVEMLVIRKMTKVMQCRKSLIPNTIFMLGATSLIATFVMYKSRRDGLSDNTRRMMMLSLLSLSQCFLSYLSNLNQIRCIKDNFIEKFALREADFDDANDILPPMNRRIHDLSEVNCDK